MARGIGIVLVVYGHCLRGLADAGVVDRSPVVMLSDYMIYTFHMPLFFAISGFLFRAEGVSAGRMWIARLKAIAYPYLLWSVVQGSIQLLLARSGAVNTPLDPARLLQIGWNPISPFWFLYALFLAGIFAFYLRKLDPVWLVAIGLAAFVVTAVLRAGMPNDVSYGLLYFAVGLLVRSRGWYDAVPARLPAVIAMTAAFLVVALSCHTLGVPERWPFVAALLGMMMVLSLCRFLEAGGGGGLVAGLAALGRYSMGIYVMHILVLGFVRAVMLRILHIGAPGAIVAAAVPAAILIPLAVQALLVRYGLNDLAGLPFSARRRSRPA